MKKNKSQINNNCYLLHIIYDKKKKINKLFIKLNY